MAERNAEAEAPPTTVYMPIPAMAPRAARRPAIAAVIS
jgi:hypothetical protein